MIQRPCNTAWREPESLDEPRRYDLWYRFHHHLGKNIQETNSITYLLNTSNLYIALKHPALELCSYTFVQSVDIESVYNPRKRK